MRGSILATVLFAGLISVSSEARTGAVGYEDYLYGTEVFTADFGVVVEYAPRDTKLTESEIETLQRYLAEQAATLDQPLTVKIAVWADYEYDTSADLSDAQVRLAEDRINQLANAIRAYKGDVEVIVYNMAKRASALDRWAGTEEAQLKDAERLITVGEGITDDAIIMWENGAPRSAVVLARPQR